MRRRRGIEGEQKESGTNEDEGKTEEDLEGSHEHLHGLQELQVHGLASVLRLSREGHRALSFSLSPGNSSGLIIRLAFNVENYIEGVLRARLAGGERFESNSVSLVFASGSVGILSLEFRMVEHPLASVIRVLGSIS